ncbi:MAG: ATP-binding protein [Myxococcota bacterium]
MRGLGEDTQRTAPGVAAFVRRWQDVLERTPVPGVVVSFPDEFVHFVNLAGLRAGCTAQTLEAIVPSADVRRRMREACQSDGFWEGDVGLAGRATAVPIHGEGSGMEGMYFEAGGGPVPAEMAGLVVRLRAADREVRQLRQAARFGDVRQAVAMAVGRGVGLSELAIFVLERLERVMPIREARVTLLEDDTLRVYVCRRDGEPANTEPRVLVAASPAGLSRARRAAVQVVVGPSVDLYPALRPHAANGVRCALYAPLEASEAVFGFVELYGDEREVFLVDEVALATDVARMLATAHVRERVMDQMARQAHAMELRAALGREELDRTQEQLIQAAKLSSIGELAAGLVHELNQPLNVLGGYVELLREGALAPPAQNRALDVMTRAVERMTSMVDNLRNFARSGGPTMSPVDVGAVVTMARELTVGALARGVEASCPSGLVVLGDSNRLEQVFVNLLANALQTGGDPVTVEVVALDADRVAVEVRDRGPGVPEVIRSRIFEPFFTTKPASQGTGLGLSVSARIVQDHGGRIEVRDNPGGGALFCVILPRVRGITA